MLEAIDFPVGPLPICPPGPPDGRGGITAIAADLGGHPLQDRALGRRGEQQVVVRVAVDVHKTRRGGQPSRIDDPVGVRASRLWTDRLDRVPRDSNGPRAGRAAFAVVDLRATDQDIRLHRLPSPRRIRASGSAGPDPRGPCGFCR